MKMMNVNPQKIIDKIKSDKWKKNLWKGNIEQKTIRNDNYRKVEDTNKHAQLVFMSLKPKQEIGNEVHKKVDQFFRVEQGKAQFLINNKLKFTEPSNGAVFVPANTWHNVINPSSTQKLKLYTIYSPPNHPKGLIQHDRPARDNTLFYENIKPLQMLLSVAMKEKRSKFNASMQEWRRKNEKEN
jgi:mannose-6-phosphate isomerase-like protein (cupin superfamily)